MDKLVNVNREKVIDLLLERLTFERAGVKLYDAIIDRIQSSGDAQMKRMLEQLRENRDQEKEHEEWLEEQIRAAGGDPRAMGDLAKLVEQESSGIESVILEGTPEISHMLHALLVAELADNAGWDLLVDLASEAADEKAKREFKKRLHEEEDHLLFTRRAVERFARREVLHQDVSLPVSP
jgi:bacterioferritin (cytochrome b1)